jgi:hypothetical protein
MELQNRGNPPATASPRACDFCHWQTNVRWLDQDKWACAPCARLYVKRLEQEVMEKKYTAPFTARQVRGMVVGMIFSDKGRRMRIVRIGTAYIDSTGKPAFDAWAVPDDEKKCAKCGSTGVVSGAVNSEQAARGVVHRTVACPVCSPGAGQ